VKLEQAVMAMSIAIFFLFGVAVLSYRALDIKVNALTKQLNEFINSDIPMDSHSETNLKEIQLKK
jgi:hypothetical protein